MGYRWGADHRGTELLGRLGQAVKSARLDDEATEFGLKSVSGSSEIGVTQ